MKCVPQTVSKRFLKEGETDGKATYVPGPLTWGTEILFTHGT